jgi:uncharacterized protein (DUF169 family)
MAITDMTNFHVLDALKLQWRPVAIAFMSTPPAGLPRVDRALPAGCAYWKHASEGHGFYTTPEDHYNCTVGAFTHGVTLPDAQKRELESVIGTMINLEYLKGDEVASIPHRVQPLQVAAYAPLADATFAPDVVIFRGNARQLMLMSEAARSAGIFGGGDILGRPACAMIPQTVNTGGAVASFACIGNRVYTDLADDEFYVTLPGRGLSAVLEALATILKANTQLEAFHQSRNV